LVGGALAQGLAGTVLAFGMVRHAVRPLLAWDKLRAMLGFGVGISLNDLLNYVARNGDNFVVGWWLGAPALGLYARAYNLMTLPVTYVSSAMSSVLFPAFSEIQAEPDRLGRAYLASIRVGTIVAAPAMAGLAVAAPHLIRGVYGDRWMGAVLPLQVLCAAGIFRAVYHHAGALTQASGQVYAEARRQMMYAALVVLGSLAGTLWGLVGVSVAVAAAILFMYVAMAQLSLTITGRSWGQFLAAQRAGIALGTLVGLVALALRALLERAGMGDLAILIGIMAGIAALSPLALLLLPPLTLPITLAVRQRMMAERLPGPLRDMLARTLHSTGVGTPQ
jgi:O-antigen/teichoic acid export membrane protein